jgi:peptidoglycan-associated lipoprotein
MRRSALLLALAASLLGCPGHVKYPECKVDEDCKEHTQVCISGTCRQCRDDAQCPQAPVAQVCKDNACAAKPQCTSNKDCAAGQKCAQDKCVPECTEATAEQDCGGAGRKCFSGRCAAEEDCLADGDCGDGKACVQQRCVAQGELLASRSERQHGDCEVKAVYFGFDESTLSADSRQTLSQDWQCLQKSPYRRLVLTGHTDERGTTEYNLALGARRAEAVKRYLAGLGAEERKLKTLSYGKERPADNGHDDAAWARDRRVELIPEAP